MCHLLVPRQATLRSISKAPAFLRNPGVVPPVRIQKCAPRRCHRSSGPATVLALALSCCTTAHPGRPDSALVLCLLHAALAIRARCLPVAAERTSKSGRRTPTTSHGSRLHALPCLRATLHSHSLPLHARDMPLFSPSLRSSWRCRKPAQPLSLCMFLAASRVRTRTCVRCRSARLVRSRATRHGNTSLLNSTVCTARVLGLDSCFTVPLVAGPSLNPGWHSAKGQFDIRSTRRIDARLKMP